MHRDLHVDLADSQPRRLFGRRIGCGATAVLLALILAALGAWIFHRVESWPGRVASQVRKAFVEVAGLQPRVTVNNRVFFEETKSVLEVAVVSRETRVEREMEHEWLGSKKRIKLRGVYHVKAGFDLTQRFSVSVQDRRVYTELPPPRILSVDPGDIEVLELQNGIWNKIHRADLEAELRSLPVLARQRASEAGLQAEALKLFTERLRDKLAPDFEVEVRVSDPLNVMKPPSI